MLMSVAIALALFAQLAAPGEDLRVAAKAMDARDYPTAVRHFREALKTDPRNTKILGSLGLCLAGVGSFSEAAEQFRALVKLEKKSCDLMVLNGPAAMDALDNQVEVLDETGQVIAAIDGSKEDVARGIMRVIEERLISAE